MDKTLSKTVSVSSVAVYSTQIKQISKPDQTLTVKIIMCLQYPSVRKKNTYTQKNMQKHQWILTKVAVTSSKGRQFC